MTTIKKNKLIAEFMGVSPDKKGWYDGFALHKAGLPFAYGAMGNGTFKPPFSTDWNWLMVAVKKIYDLELEDEPVLIVRDALADASLQGTYDAVVEFIVWYNQTK